MKFALSIFAITALLLPTGFLQAQEPSGHDRNQAVISYFNSGIALMDQFKFEEAVQEFNKLLELDGKVLPAWVNLGIAYFYGQHYPEALAAFAQALKLDPEEIHAHFVSGLIYINQDQV